MNPHLQKDIASDSELGVLFNPVILGAKWLATATKFLLSDGRVLVNPSGGIAVEVLDVTSEIEQDGYPSSEPIPDEIVYISQWLNGRHFYLRSSKERLFPFDKVDSMADARRKAAKYAPGARVEIVEPQRVYTREGD